MRGISELKFIVAVCRKTQCFIAFRVSCTKYIPVTVFVLRERHLNFDKCIHVSRAAEIAPLRTQEEFMRFLNLAAGVAVLSLAAGSAFADSQPSTLSGCLAAAHEVRGALDANAQSPNYEDAVAQQRYGQEYCTNNFYAQGIEHYNHALTLLVPNKS
jgi:hypothetical protein